MVQLQDSLPPLKERGTPELVAAMGAVTLLSYQVTVDAASSYALVFRDADGNQIRMASTDYSVMATAEGTIAEVDESTKSTAGVTILSKDYAGSGTNFVNKLNVIVVGRLDGQPAL